jgi:hypothetical protein
MLLLNQSRIGKLKEAMFILQYRFRARLEFEAPASRSKMEIRFPWGRTLWAAGLPSRFGRCAGFASSYVRSAWYSLLRRNTVGAAAEVGAGILAEGILRVAILRMGTPAGAIRVGTSAGCTSDREDIPAGPREHLPVQRAHRICLPACGTFAPRAHRCGVCRQRCCGLRRRCGLGLAGALL